MINERGMIYKSPEKFEEFYLADFRAEWQKLHDSGQTTMSFLSWLNFNGTNLTGGRVQPKEADNV